MPVEDLRVNCQLKSILTRHWIDQKELGTSVHGGTVRLRGELRRLASSEEHGPVDAQVLSELVQEIRRIEGVKKVYFLDVLVRATEVTTPRAAEGEVGEDARPARALDLVLRRSGDRPEADRPEADGDKKPEQGC
jgi:hypothetical protein